MNTSALLEVLEVYFEAFAEHDPVRRGELLTQCLTPDCVIWGHSHVFAGHVAISDKIAALAVSEIAPDGRSCRIVPLWETDLPPMPGSWPAQLAVQPLPKVSNAA